MTVVWMTSVILSHIFVLGYGWFFIDAVVVMVVAGIYLLLTRWHSQVPSTAVNSRLIEKARRSADDLSSRPPIAAESELKVRGLGGFGGG